MKPTLDAQDLEVLMEALQAWENKDLAGDMMETMLVSALMPKDNPVAKAQYERETEERRVKRSEDQKLRKQRSILLQAKLIQMSDQDKVNRFADELLQQRNERPYHLNKD